VEITRVGETDCGCVAAPVGCERGGGRSVLGGIEVDVGTRSDEVAVVVDHSREEGVANEVSLSCLPVHGVDPARVASVEFSHPLGEPRGPPSVRLTTKWWWFCINAQARVLHAYLREIRVYMRRKHSCSPAELNSVCP
jgi:hypothetical protein